MRPSDAGGDVLIGPRFAPRTDVDVGTGGTPPGFGPRAAPDYDESQDDAPVLYEAQAPVVDLPRVDLGDDTAQPTHEKTPGAQRAPAGRAVGREAVLRLPALVSFYNQNGWGACVTYSACWNLSIRNGGRRFDARWLFQETKRQDDDPTTKPSDTKHGVLEEDVLRVLATEGPRPWGATRPDPQYRIGKAYALRDVRALREALARGRSGMIGGAWFDYWYAAQLLKPPGRSPLGRAEWWTCANRVLSVPKKLSGETLQTLKYWADNPKQFGFYGVRWVFDGFASGADLIAAAGRAEAAAKGGKLNPEDAYGWHEWTCYGYSPSRRAFACVNNWGTQYPHPVWFPEEVYAALFVARPPSGYIYLNGYTWTDRG
jgi:hypothetical protein